MNEPHTGAWQGESVLPVSVIIGCSAEAKRPRNWSVRGVVVGERFASDTVSCLPMRSGPEGELYLWKGFSLRLRPAQANDYALNINTPHPSVYVVADRDESDSLRPLSTTVSLDEAQNLDATDLRTADQQVFSVPMPPEVYRWVEHFVLDHYQPKQRKFRGKSRSKALYDAEVGDRAGED